MMLFSNVTYEDGFKTHGVLDKFLQEYKIFNRDTKGGQFNRSMVS